MGNKNNKFIILLLVRIITIGGLLTSYLIILNEETGEGGQTSTQEDTEN